MSSAFPLRCSESSFRAIARGVVPESAQLTDGEWSRVYAVIAHALAARPPAIVRQLSMFVTVLGMLARARYRQPLATLQQEKLEAHLHTFETAPIPILRKGMWGLRTLILMGFYARPAAGREIGYRGHASGWTARRSMP